MATLINADTSDGLKLTSDTSGEIQLQSGGTTIATVDSTGITMASGKLIASTGPAFSAYQSTQQTGIGVTVDTKILFQTELYDTNSNFASSRFTPTVAGYYQINASVANSGSTWSNGYMTTSINKNGSNFHSVTMQPNNGNWVSVPISATVYLNGSTDYVEIYAICAGISTAWSVSPNGTYIYFDGFLARAA